MPNAILSGPMICELAGKLRDKLTTPYEMVCVPRGRPAVDVAAHADVLVSESMDATMPAMPKLRLLQVPLVGLDLIDFQAVPPQAAICNVDGHEIAVGEYVLLAVLAWTRRYIQCDATFRSGDWGMSSRTGGPLLNEAAGKSVGIVGYGRVGRAVAARAAAIGMHVLVCNRTPFGEDARIASRFAWTDLHSLLRASDFLVVSCAATSETVGIIGRAAFSAMRADAVVINVARGEIVDEDALYEACLTRKIAGAVIDTWYRYPSQENLCPRPSRHPFERLPNVVMTPHISAWTMGTMDRRLQQIAGNMDHLTRGEALTHIVRPAG